MRVTVLGSLPPIKGISSYMSGFLAGLSESGCDVDALGFKNMYPEFLYPDKSGTKDDSLKPIRLPRVNTRMFLTWYNPLGWAYAGLTAKGDVLHAQWWTFVLAPIYVTVLSLAKIRRKKIIITAHNIKLHESSFLKDLAYKSVFALGDHFIVHTDGNKKSLAKNFSIDIKKISVVPHGVILPNAPIEGIDKSEARKRLNIPNDARVVLFFGIIRDYKGVATLLEAFAKVREQVPEAYLVIAGKPWEEWSKYQQIIDRHDMDASIKKALKFIPEDDIESYFRAADLVVLPYKHFDAQSGAGSLALPFGNATLVTGVGGLPGLVDDDNAICKPEDPIDMSSKISKILKDQKLRQKLERDSAKIAKTLSWDAIGNETCKVYSKVSSGE